MTNMLSDIEIINMVSICLSRLQAVIVLYKYNSFTFDPWTVYCT